MTLETEAILDRRRLKRSISVWRILAIVAGAVALLAVIIPTASPSGGWLPTKQIARVEISGLITEDRDLLTLLKRLAKDKSVEAVIVSVNSPGGTTVGGEAVFEALRELAKTKPVVAVFGTIATSAAYIVGLATDRIVARGNTITGSVGVIFQWAEVSQLLEKLGVKMHEIKSGALKANPSMFQPLDPAGRKIAEQMVQESQRWFLGLVKSRRGIDAAAVPGLQEGRVFSGREALGHKLIDEIGSEAEAIRWLEEKRGVTKSLKIVDRKAKRAAQWSWLRGATAYLLSLLGPAGERIAQFLVDERGWGLTRLDGLLSVWQPTEN
ncbi:MAG: signal peptide peptidase SppA [Hyphomicrobiaceae bacterium]|nr:signal peptide peptidase SppA [Hyphomicrobiaceae bacterium]